MNPKKRISTITITPVLCEYPSREEKAREIIQWLVSLKAIQPKLTKCTELEGDLGYALDTGAKAISEFPERLPFHLNNNGLTVITNYAIYTPGKDLEHFDCPVCNKEIAELDVDPYLHRHYTKFNCSFCGIASPIHDWKIVPEWSFSNLGFVFCNWPDFTHAFLQEFSMRLGCKLKIIKIE